MGDLSGQEDGGFVITQVDRGKNEGRGQFRSLPKATQPDRHHAASPQGQHSAGVISKW